MCRRAASAASSTRYWSATVHARRLPDARAEPLLQQPVDQPDRLLRRPRLGQRGAQRRRLLPTRRRGRGGGACRARRGPSARPAACSPGSRPSSACADPPGHLVARDHQRARAQRHAQVLGRHGDVLRPPASASSSSIAASPLSRRSPSSSTPVISTLGTHRSSAVRLAHAALAERRQHVADVVEEHAGSGRRRARRRAPAGDGARTAGTRRGAGRPRSCRCRGRPARRASARAGHGSPRPARPGSWRRSRASPRCAPRRSRRAPGRGCPDPAASSSGSSSCSSRYAVSSPSSIVNRRRWARPNASAWVAR